MSANDKKSEVFSYLKKVIREFLTRSHDISLNKGVLNTSRICINAIVCMFESPRTHDRVNRLCVLRSFHDLLG